MLNRRTTLGLLAAPFVAPQAAFARTAKEIKWEDLIPAGVPYSQIVGEGEMDVANDTWLPVYDANGTKFNETLNGAYIKMPGFIIPFDVTDKGVTDFMLVPYQGACIHTPPPPANQLVIVSAKDPWPSDELWDPVWVTGTLQTQLQNTSLGQVGYAISADDMETYVW